MRIRLPRTRLFRVYVYIVCFALIVVAADLVLVPIGRHITIGHDTTRITSPLRPDGMPDYVKAINDQYSAGVTPANNAVPLLLAAVGPAALPTSDVPAIYERLSMPPLPASGNYFVPFETYSKQQNPGAKIDSEKIEDQVAAAGRAPWKTEDNPQLATWLNTMTSSLALVHQAAKRPRYFLPLMPSNASSEALNAAHLGPLGAFRALAQAICARAMLHIGQHDFAGAQADLLAVHQFARLIVEGPSLVDFLVAVHMDNDALTAERGLAAGEFFTPAMARQLLADLGALPPFPNASKDIDENERYKVIAGLLDSVRTGPGTMLSQTQDNYSHLSSSKRFVLDHIACNFNSTLRQANRFIDAQVAAYRAPTFADRRAQTRATERAIFDFDDRYQDSVLHPADRLLARLCPALGNVQALADQRCVNMDLTRIALALGAYHAERGAYPNTLSALAPTYLPAIPRDLFIDKPLYYQTTSGGYLLYAVGPNMIDDHGHNRHKDRADPNADDLTVLVGEFPAK